MQGIILFAHGARDSRWAVPFEHIRDQVVTQTSSQIPAAEGRGQNAVGVSLAYLELMQPDLQTAAAELVRQGAKRIRVVPLFLGQGGHLRRDLPLLIAELEARYPAVPFDVAQAAGEDPGVQRAIVAYSLARMVSDPADHSGQSA